MTNLRIGLLATALALAFGSCAWAQKQMKPPSQCGDPCATMTCPFDMQCVVSGNCAAFCEQLPAQRP